MFLDGVDEGVAQGAGAAHGEIGALQVVVEHAEADEGRRAARGKAVVAALRGEHGAQERILDDGVDDVGEGGAEVFEEEGHVGGRVDEAGEITELLRGADRRAELAQDLEEAVDALALVGKIAHEAVPVAVRAARHRDLVAGEDQAIDPVGGDLAELDGVAEADRRHDLRHDLSGPHSPM